MDKELMAEGYREMGEENLRLAEESIWCPQQGYPEPCVKCDGMAQAGWDKFFESLAEAVKDVN